MIKKGRKVKERVKTEGEKSRRIRDKIRNKRERRKKQ